MRTEHITRCPHCASVFRVLPEQLQQAEGWLRCGQCHQSFDATDRVVAWQAETSPVADGHSPRVELDTLLRTEDRGASMASRSPHSWEMPASAAPALSDEVLAFEQALASFPRPELAPPASQPASDEAFEHDVPAAVPARHHGALAWMAVVLIALLLAQAVWATRALWAVHWPALGQGAQALCERAGCVLTPWREPRVLVLEHARLVRTDTGFELHWGLHNTAAWPLVTPSIELTLLDAQEQVLTRRVLAPAEAQVPALLAPQQHWSGLLAWPWSADTPVASYRLLAFYP